jgi:RNA 2',3'-cyclic 3'-phosphodiesterase
MRAFLGIEPDAKTKLAIETWRDKVFPPFKQVVPAANYHLTLAFLGQISVEQQAALEQHLQSMDQLPQFKVELDLLGYWPKPKALWIGCSNPAESHLELVNNLIQVAHLTKIAMLKRAYQAHLTLVRKCHDNPPHPLFPPDFTWQANAFHLYESISRPQGVIYVIKKTWYLAPIISARIKT